MLIHLNSRKPLMKPTGNAHGRTPLNSWHHQPKMKSAVLQKIRAITVELEAIQAEMHSELTDPAHQSAKFFEDTTAVSVMNDFKAEMDQLRRILWFYTKDAASK